MNCGETRKYIAEKAGEKRFLDDFPDIARHIRQCELCRIYYEDIILTRALIDLPVPEPDRDFSASLLENAIARHKKRRKKRTVAWFTAAAAILAAIFAGGVMEYAGLQSPPADNGHTAAILSTREETTINILIEAQQARQGAVFTVDLEGDIALKDIPGRRRVQWQADLVQGRNLLELSVEIADPSGGHLQVGYRYNGVERQVKIPVQPHDKNGRENTAKT